MRQLPLEILLHILSFLGGDFILSGGKSFIYHTFGRQYYYSFIRYLLAQKLKRRRFNIFVTQRDFRHTYLGYTYNRNSISLPQKIASDFVGYSFFVTRLPHNYVLRISYRTKESSGGMMIKMYTDEDLNEWRTNSWGCHQVRDIELQKQTSYPLRVRYHKNIPKEIINDMVNRIEEEVELFC